MAKKKAAKTRAAKPTKKPPPKPGAEGPAYIAAGLWPLVVERAAVERLARNPRHHDEPSLLAIEQSLKQFGQRKPLVVNRKNGQVEAGNGMLEAAGRLGWDRVAVLYVEDDQQTQHGFVIADNRTAELSEWDDAVLASLLVDLQADAPDLLSDLEDAMLLDQLLADSAAPESGEAPAPRSEQAAELQRKWKTKLGQLWEIPSKTVPGKCHRVLCGDSTKEEDVRRVMGGETPFLCVTDPPYGVEYDPAWRNRAAAEGKLAYAASRIGQVANDDRADWSDAWRLFPGDVLYSWHPADATSLVHAAAIQGSGFEIRMQIVWTKSNFAIGRGDYHVRHEPCWYAVRKGKAAKRTDDRTQTTVWEINLDRNVEGGHGTQKPLECMARPIRNHGAKGDGVYDPFLGSGTTLVACEQLGRLGYGIEIEPKYVAVCLERMTEMGLEPRLVRGAEPKKARRRHNTG